MMTQRQHDDQIAQRSALGMPISQQILEGVMNQGDVVDLDVDALKGSGNVSGIAASGNAHTGNAGFGVGSLIWRGGRAHH
jgi:hypothetical protein